MSCSVEGCARSQRYKNPRLCSLHYQRQRKYGDPLGGGTLKGAPLQWLKEHVCYTGGDCLLWPFSRSDNGYGDLRVSGKRFYAHRMMCELAHGEPASRMDAAHSCGNGHLACVNPRHLRWATRLENVHDAMRHGTTSRGEKHSIAIRRAFGCDVTELRREGQAQFGEKAA